MEIQPLRRVVGHQQNSIDALRNLSDHAFFQSLPPGYRFQPTDEELIVHYLAKKVKNEPLPRNKINDVNLYEYNPETLSKMFKESGVKDWYFFTPRNRKYRNGQRPNRAAGNGYWKATGADKSIENSKGEKVGFRKALVFYVGKPPKGDKTSWIMHEYRVYNSPECDRSVHAMRLDNWVLCRIYKKVDRAINMRNVKTASIEDESERHEEEEDEIDPDAVDGCSTDIGEGHTLISNENYNNFETVNGSIGGMNPSYRFDNPYIWCDNRVAEFPLHNIIDADANINRPQHMKLGMHHVTGHELMTHNSYAENWHASEYNEKDNIKLLNHGTEHDLTRSSYLENWHFRNTQEAIGTNANAGLLTHNPYPENSQPPEQYIKANHSTTESEQAPDEYDLIDQFLMPIESIENKSF